MKHRFFYGWFVVSLAFIANTVPAGLYFFGFSVFFLPISRDLGLSRAATSLPFSLARIIAAIQSTFIGMAADRFGPGHILFVGALMGGLGYVLLSFANSYFGLAFPIRSAKTLFKELVPTLATPSTSLAA